MGKLEIGEADELHAGDVVLDCVVVELEKGLLRVLRFSQRDIQPQHLSSPSRLASSDAMRHFNAFIGRTAAKSAPGQGNQEHRMQTAEFTIIGMRDEQCLRSVVNA
ncbi:MAG: hypothetical protein KF909_15980, partial [Rhodocyclaceae bacterium]|nr:hypothetical protein [Rhodocyclaceae bacterium]